MVMIYGHIYFVWAIIENTGDLLTIIISSKCDEMLVITLDPQKIIGICKTACIAPDRE